MIFERYFVTTETERGLRVIEPAPAFDIESLPIVVTRHVFNFVDFRRARSTS